MSLKEKEKSISCPFKTYTQCGPEVRLKGTFLKSLDKKMIL
jgi:hypothetical protein